MTEPLLTEQELKALLVRAANCLLAENRGEGNGLMAMRYEVIERLVFQAKLALRSERAGTVPPGFVIVPVEPTEEMVDAACKLVMDRIRRRMENDKDAPGVIEAQRQTYRAMLAAAPPHGWVADVRDLDTPAVRFYERDFYVLSNFSAFSVWWRGCHFPTSEHAYHWAKFPQPEHQAAILKSISAHEAFKYAERFRADRHADWDAIKVNVMRDILHAKAGQHEYVARKLLQTGDRELIEDSWRDDFWGWGPNRDGQNMLGKLWMDIRAGIRAAAPPRPREGGGG